MLHKKLLEEGLEELSHVNSKKKKAIEREIKRRFRTNSRVSPKKKGNESIGEPHRRTENRRI